MRTVKKFFFFTFPVCFCLFLQCMHLKESIYRYLSLKKLWHQNVLYYRENKSPWYGAMVDVKPLFTFLTLVIDPSWVESQDLPSWPFPWHLYRKIKISSVLLSHRLGEKNLTYAFLTDIHHRHIQKINPSWELQNERHCSK